MEAKMFSKNTIISSVMAIALSTPVACFAENDQPRSVAVRVDDLNLASDSGKAALTARVEQAAAKLCGTVAQQHGLIEREQAQTCRSEALASAEPQMQKAIASATATAKIAISLRSDR
jgi:UrcA family protein